LVEDARLAAIRPDRVANPAHGFFGALNGQRVLNRSGASSASITCDSILLAALIGFIAAAGRVLHRFRAAP
jgi:hypothetical protein